MAYKGPKVVVGPSSSTDNTVPRFDLTSGDLIQTSSVTIDDSDVMGGITEVRLIDSGSNYMGIKSPSTVTSSTTLTLPDGDGASTQYLSTSGAGVLSWTQPYGLKGYFAYPSNNTWTKPTGLVRIKLTVIGGGGGSAGVAMGANQGSAGGGGGGTSISVIEAASLGATESVTIGAGGTAGASGGGAGGAGGTSSFGAHGTATGGQPGTGGGGAAGGSAGIGTVGTILISGGAGTNPAIQDNTRAGTGGSSFGGGGLGPIGSGVGGVGGNYGGGAGGSCDNNTSARAGAAGAPGFIIVEEYY